MNEKIDYSFFEAKEKENYEVGDLIQVKNPFIKEEISYFLVMKVIKYPNYEYFRNVMLEVWDIKKRKFSEFVVLPNLDDVKILSRKKG